MNIPIQNIYYMLLYAWDVLDEAESLELQPEDSTQLVDLFGRVLHAGTERVLRQGLDRGYVSCHQTLAGIRGKLELAASVKRNTLPHGRAVCEFDDLTHNVLHNRVLRATIRRLLAVSDLTPVIRDQLVDSYIRLHQIDDVELSEAVFRRIQLHRNNRHYRLLMDVCRLIHRALLIGEESGEIEFRDFVRDERRMRRLFEQFVRRFYARELPTWRVRGNNVRWVGSAESDEALTFLPRMRTDVQLVNRSRHVIIETKFVPELFQRYHGKQTLRSAHLYQLLAYLTNIVPSSSRRAVEGILLYPATEHHWDLRYTLLGIPFRVITLNLNQPWRMIQGELLKLIVESSSGEVAKLQ